MTNKTLNQTESTVEISYPELKELFTDILAKLSEEDLRDFHEEVGTMLAVDKVTMTRDEIVALAKGDISLIEERFSKTGVSVEFVVNAEKRTVVALVKFNSTGYIRSRGIAKCDPNDCFNEYIGKAIALRRAFGNPVMYEYLNAPQPEEPLVGDLVSYHSGLYGLAEYKIVVDGAPVFRRPCAHIGSTIGKEGKVIDDSARYK
ncbi:hypothetical protein [Oceanobacillus neutriphilus]|uniref:Uncharacterized protein n=1 Tax=Oceanobacillus neutriphilus TaxID=531815 RepID=A0ABQ2NY68_9BACI|nr:hypothetical protein [Oceanobacillus neutriphilus]GGP13466.1 hypothetical protein GCM10011346_33570 [Oceanobacillus neutriphilus]